MHLVLQLPFLCHLLLLLIHQPVFAFVVPSSSSSTTTTAAVVTTTCRRGGLLLSPQCYDGRMMETTYRGGDRSFHRHTTVKTRTTRRTSPLVLQVAFTPSSIPPTSTSGERDENFNKNKSNKKNLLKNILTIKKDTIKIGTLFALWYVFSVAYNIYSKRALNIVSGSKLKLAWTTACLQMPLGLLLWVLPTWALGLRGNSKGTTATTQLDKTKAKVKVKQNSFVSFLRHDLVDLLPVSILHSFVHIGGVISMGAGAVSFTYIVKASEPAVTCLLTALCMGVVLPWKTYTTLIPIMAGVALASVSELSFTWKSFNYAMISNVASSLRSIVGKQQLKKKEEKVSSSTNDDDEDMEEPTTTATKMSASNVYAIMSLLSTILVLIPLTLLMEGPPSQIKASLDTLVATNQLTPYTINIILSSLCYYLYNEVSFVVLDLIQSPITHAIGNTVKRIFIILSSIIIFGNAITTRGMIGSIMAIFGVLWYSIEKSKNTNKQTTTSSSTS